MLITRHYLTIPGKDRRVHYLRCGQGPLLLLVHQSPRSSAEFADLMRDWGENFTCIAPDTPGFGQSDPLPGEPEMAEFSDALAEFVGALGVKSCAAYGFHSGGVILVNALKRHPKLFTALAIGGYAVWDEADMALFGEDYLPPFHPQPYGEHLAWLWRRCLEQNWFFPWFAIRDEMRLNLPPADLVHVQRVVRDMLDSGNAYRAGYGAVLRAKRDVPPPGTVTPPVLITAFDGDPLQPHLARLGEIPDNWQAHPVATPDEQQEQSFAFLRAHAGDAHSQPLPEDGDAGWLTVGDTRIHWRGTPGTARLQLHRPASEMGAIGSDEIAIDMPGHGLSDPAEDLRATIEAAAKELGCEAINWPAPPPGDPALLYPDLTPQSCGEHLQRAWGAARSEAMFAPWYAGNREHAIPVDPDALKPAAIALRARARLRAGAAAADYHRLLQELAS